MRPSRWLGGRSGGSAWIGVYRGDRGDGPFRAASRSSQDAAGGIGTRWLCVPQVVRLNGRSARGDLGGGPRRNKRPCRQSNHNAGPLQHLAGAFRVRSQTPLLCGVEVLDNSMAAGLFLLGTKHLIQVRRQQAQSMSDSTIVRALASVGQRWAAQGIAYDRPASDADVAAFEARYGVVLPPDLRAYFTTLNGTAVGAYGMQDEHLLGFWHLDEVRTFAEELAGNGPSPPEAARTFVIADHSIWVYGFGIRLAGDSATATPVVVDIGSPYHQVAASFTEFLEAYLRGDEAVIYPDPKAGQSNSDVAVV